VVAADVFIYVGALEGIVRAVAGMLAEDGLFAFSVETLTDGEQAGGDGFALRPSRRYAHSEAYVRSVLAANGFSVRWLESAVIRHDRREPIDGLAVVAGKSPAV
jgi:predicted TPR repeat methyltransferase